ncbi:MAG TPA: DUF5916 domain-containing protein [Bacteroidota bacterium]|nr:DUF5916 domain-containing protein [Bacteroidota bacterium]
MPKKTAILLLLLTLLLPSLMLAGSNQKKATAVRTPRPVRIDGVLNETEWQLAKPMTDFTQYDPREGEPPTQQTEVRILYDDDALYVGWKLYDTEPSKIVARLARRDDEVESDWVSIRLDSYHDHQTAFEFTLNAAGVRTDIIQFNDGREEDASWDVVWDAETAITDDGWSAEMRIPFKVLRFSEENLQEWGMQMIRYISRVRETQHWVLIRKSESGWVSKFGNLNGLENLTRPGHVELLPYAAGGNRFVPKSRTYPDGTDFTTHIGLDAKIKPTSGLTIDATFNPDFGQVEADPAVLNLTTFETFYPEKRPFFIEGSQIIRFTTFGGDFGPGLFYSRRIGHTINVQEPDGGYIEHEPRYATILGAAKISGKMANGLSIGVLEAVTAEERARLVDSLGNKTNPVADPLTNYSLIRLRKDVFENSNAGLILTSVNRKKGLPAFTGGLDWNLKFMESEYRVEGFLAGSHIDRRGQKLDGSAGKISFNKDGGAHWRGSVSYDFTSKKYNINDIGFFRSPNDHGWVAEVLYRDDEVTDLKRIYNISGRYHLRRNFDGVEIFNSYDLAGYVMLPSYWEIDLDGSWDDGRFDPFETRGNGLLAKARSRSVQLSVESDPRQIVVADFGIGVGDDSRKMNQMEVDLEVGIKAASNISLEFNIEYSSINRRLSWVNNIVDPLISPNRITVLADRTTSEWDFTSRGSFIFTRDLTLQMYFQLFFAKGKYENTVRMATSDRFLAYSYPAPDFSELSFNSNLVLRWEYLPGSTLFLVWSQSRSGDGGTFRTPLGRDVDNLFSLPMTNAVLLKISYWLSY